ncbi:hypothetical protein vseg_004579 [Gypsophila vaccaria]
MMNLIALSLIATSFVVTGLFSPSPVTNHRGDHVIVKDGHRAVVVEYADDVSGDGNTKVLISPPHHAKVASRDDEGGVAEEALSRATASVAGVAEDVKDKAMHGGPRELICDAFGKCKHKVAGVLGRAKGKVAEAEETVGETVGSVKEKVRETGEKVRETAEEAKEKGKREILDVGRRAREKAVEAEETVEDALGTVKEKVRETGEKVRGTAEGAKEKVRETGEKVRETAEEAKEKGKKELKGIGRRTMEVVKDVMGYVLVGVESIGSVMNLVGVGTGYGMGVWVTFVMSYVLAQVLPRQQFGVVQSKVYPLYFKGMVGCIGLGLLGHLLGHRGRVFKTRSEVLQGYNLLSSLLTVLGNLLFLEPRATKVMFERMKLEKEEGRGLDSRGAPTRVIDTVVTEPTGAAPITATTARTTVTEAQPTRPDQDAVKSKLSKLDERLKKLNSYSSLLNIMTLVGLTWHLMYLSQRLSVTA